MRRYKGYIFDFDGTLFDTYESLISVYKKGFAAVGETCTEEDVKTYMRESLYFTAGRRGYEGKTRDTFIKVVNDSLDDEDSLSLIRIYPEVREVLGAIRKEGAEIGIVSGNKDAHIVEVLKRFGLTSYFSALAGSTSVKEPKPSAAPINAIKARWQNVKENDMVYVGDSLYDPLTAKNAGIDGVLIDRLGEHPDYEGLRIADLRELFGKD